MANQLEIDIEAVIADKLAKRFSVRNRDGCRCHARLARVATLKHSVGLDEPSARSHRRGFTSGCSEVDREGVLKLIAEEPCSSVDICIRANHSSRPVFDGERLLNRLATDTKQARIPVLRKEVCDVAQESIESRGIDVIRELKFGICEPYGRLSFTDQEVGFADMAARFSEFRTDVPTDLGVVDAADRPVVVERDIGRFEAISPGDWTYRTTVIAVTDSIGA